MKLKTLGIVVTIIAIIVLIVTDPAFVKGFWEGWNR
jgi:hypothetical protein